MAEREHDGIRRGVRRGIRRVLRLAIRSPRLTRADVDAEIEFHLRERTDHLIAIGLPADAAAAEARRRFGDPMLARHELVSSAQRQENVMQLRERFQTFAADCRLAVRGFRRTPMFVIIAVSTLALGIGANTTVFSWMEALVLDPLPVVSDVRGLVSLSTGTPSGGTQPISYPDYLDWSAATRRLAAVVAYRRERLSVRTTAGGDARAIWGVLVSSNYFDVLGVKPMLGRAFRADESAPRARAGGAPVVVIGYDLWQRELGGSTAVLGRLIWLNGHAVTVIGVAPPGFRGTNVGFAFDLWAPITMQPTLLGQPVAKLSWRNSRWLTAFGRLAPGITVQQAAAELSDIGARVAAAHAEDKGTKPAVRPLLDAEASRTLEPVFLALLGATGLVLAIVCFNLAGLHVVRANARGHELSVRLALGASRGRIVQQLLIEAALLALASLPFVLATTLWARRVLGHFLVSSVFPVAELPGVNVAVLVFAALLASVVVFAIALWPALRASTQAPAGLGSNRTTSGTHRVRETLIVVQLALSLVAVATAALLVRGLDRLRATDTGLVDPEHVLVATTDFDLSGPGYAGFDDDPAIRARRLPAAMEILRRVRSLPGVRDATLMDTPPLGLVTGFDSFDTEVPGYSPGPNEDTAIEISYVTPGFFTTVGPAIAHGRTFDATNPPNSPGVAIVNAAFARRFWKGVDPASAVVGKTIRAGGKTLTVVGVTRDTKYHFLTESALPFLYLSYEQWSPTALAVAVRTVGDPAAVAEPLRRIFHDVDPALPFFQPRTLADQVDGALTIQRLAATLLTALGGLAITIAGLGLYGALTQAVQQRQREIGIRMALGARATDIARQFAARGLGLAAIAGLLALPGVLAAAGVLRAQIDGIGAMDPLALAAATLVFIGVAGASSLVTAAGAARIDPATSIRNE
jgi:predicted permease